MNPKETGINFLRTIKRGSILTISLAGAWAIACQTPQRPGSSPYDSNTQFLPSEAVIDASYQQFLKNTIGKECDLPRIEFQQWNNSTQDSVLSIGGAVIPPKAPGGPTRIVLADNMLEIHKKYAAQIGISDVEFKRIKDQITILHEGMHVCSQYDMEGKSDQAPIIEYNDPTIYKKDADEFRAVNRVYITRGYINSGLNLEVEVTIMKNNGQTESQRFHEPGSTEELITHWLTRQYIIKHYGSQSVQLKVLDKGDPYQLSQVILTGLFSRDGLNYEQVLDAKKKKDLKPVFDSIRQSLISIGHRQGIDTTNKDPQRQNWFAYSILTNLSTPDGQISKLNPNVFTDLLSEFYFDTRFSRLDRSSQAWIASVFLRLSSSN